MSNAEWRHDDPLSWELLPAFASLIASIGGSDFQEELFKFLHGVVGADYCTVFHFREMTPQVVGSTGKDGCGQASEQSRFYVDGGHWRDDPAYAEMQNRMPSGQPSLTRLDVARLPAGALRALCERGNIRDKILLCSGSVEDAIGISVLRSVGTGPFSDDHIRRMEHLASTLLAITAKHKAVRSVDFSSAFSSIGVIEEVVGHSSRRLPKREVEVCARIIYGVCAADIAAELGISAETVVTYRKRLYQRLHIATQRELLLRYISAWRQVKGSPSDFVPVKGG